jgi:hypothetical protein
VNAGRALIIAGGLLLPCLAVPCSAAASNKDSTMDQQSRSAPPHVAPIVIDGVRYSQLIDSGRLGLSNHGGWLLASDAKSGAHLWTAQVYEVHIDPADETDVQEVYFETMTRVAGKKALAIRNESGKAFVIDLETRQVRSAD